MTNLKNGLVVNNSSNEQGQKRQTQAIENFVRTCDPSSHLPILEDMFLSYLVAEDLNKQHIQQAVCFYTSVKSLCTQLSQNA